MPVALYYLGLAFLFTHELDAITHAEWRLLPLLRGMPDATASPLFVSAHVLLFFGITWLSQHPLEPLRQRTRIVAAAFLVVHGVAHFSLTWLPHYDFNGALSQVLIGFAAVFGAAFLVAGPLRGR